MTTLGETPVKELALTALINGNPVDLALDTRAQATVPTMKTCGELCLSLESPRRLLVGAGDSPLKILGEAEVDITRKGRSIKIRVLVVRGASRNPLGVDEICRLNLIAAVNSLTTKDASFNSFEVYPTLFESLGTMPETFKILLKQDTQPYCLYSPRSIPVGLREKAHARLQEMLAQGVISEMEEPTAWCSGLTKAPKANNDIRFCVDLTRLNKGVWREGSLSLAQDKRFDFATLPRQGVFKVGC